MPAMFRRAALRRSAAAWQAIVTTALAHMHAIDTDNAEW
jgi:hypothetical protein